MTSGANEDKLLRMARQMAGFFETQGPGGAAGLAAHLNETWAPRMRAALAARIDGAPAEMPPLLVAARPLIRA